MLWVACSQSLFYSFLKFTSKGGNVLGNGTWVNVGGNQAVTYGGAPADVQDGSCGPYLDADGRKSWVFTFLMEAYYHIDAFFLSIRYVCISNKTTYQFITCVQLTHSLRFGWLSMESVAFTIRTTVVSYSVSFFFFNINWTFQWCHG